MSNTAPKILLSTNEWSLVSTGASSGHVTNEGTLDVIYREATTDPTAAEKSGHTLRPQKSVNFVLDASQQIWMRAKGQASIVLLTED